MRKNSFVEGTIIATLAIVFTKILGMLYVIPFYSIIGSQGSSLYSYAYNIYMIFLSISSAGIPTAMSKIVSEYESQGLKETKVRSFKIGIFIVSILSVLCFLVLMFFSESIAKLIVGDMTGGNSLEDITLVIFVVSFAVLIIPFFSVARGYLQGHKYIQPSSTSQMIEQIVRIVVIIVGSFFIINILHKSVSLGVAVAVAGAFVGGLAAILYIARKIFTHKKELSLDEKLIKDKVSNKEILKKICSYAIPFVIINLTVNIYNTVDMSLIIRTLSSIGYSGADAEFVAGVITTWGYKLNMIVTAVATGLTVSLIPNIVSAYTLKKYNKVNKIFNKALQIILFISIPAAFGLSFLAYPVWNIFYGIDAYGPTVFKLSIITAVFCNFYLITIQTAQSVNKYKIVYIAVITGFLTNALLDVPLMLLCNKIGLPPYYGASFATMLGYTIAIVIVLVALKKIKDMRYGETWKMLFKTIGVLVVMLVVLSLLKLILPFHTSTKMLSIIDIVIYAVVGALVYLFLMYKMGIIKDLFGQKVINKVLKIITFGKYKVKECENDTEED